MVVMATFLGFDALPLLVVMISVLGFSVFKFLRPDYIKEYETKRAFPEVPWKLAVAFCLGALLLVLAGAGLNEHALLVVGLILFGLGGFVIFLTFLYQVLA